MYPSRASVRRSVFAFDDRNPAFAAFFESLLTDPNPRPLLTTEVQARYARARPGTSDRVFPANRASAVCQPCPRVPARANLRYLSRTRELVYFPNEQQLIRARKPRADPGRCRFRLRTCVDAMSSRTQRLLTVMLM